MLSEILSPVRNVPSIVYSGFLNHPHRPNISGPFGQSVSSDIGTSFTSETQKYKPKQVSFIPSNDNELLAISTTKDISGDTQFIVPTYTKPPANKLPATKDANTKHEKDTMITYLKRILELYLSSDYSYCIDLFKKTKLIHIQFQFFL